MGLAAGLGRHLGWESGGWLVVAAPLAGIVLGAGWGLLHPPSWTSVASAIDDSHQLKDRAATACEFAQQDHPTGLQRLQMQEALERLRSIDVRRAAPFTWPRLLPASILLGGLAVGLLGLPPRRASVSMQLPPPQPQMTQLAASLDQTMLEELKQLASQVPEDTAERQELQTLVDQLSQRIAAIQLPGVEARMPWPSCRKCRSSCRRWHLNCNWKSP